MKNIFSAVTLGACMLTFAVHAQRGGESGTDKTATTTTTTTAKVDCKLASNAGKACVKTDGAPGTCTDKVCK